MSFEKDGKRYYQNPVIFADFSDPDPIVFGDYYYMTASSFQYTPGLPILRSGNLADWELIGYALDKIPEKRFDLPQVSHGVWAPSMRVYDAYVWIFYGMPDEGIYAVKAERPEGPWSRPCLIKKGKGLIDPCPYFDGEGNGYMVHAYAKSRIGFKSALSCFQFMKNGEAFDGEDRLSFLDHARQPTLEGPKVYERNGYIYIFAPAGGVTTGWQTVLRSRSIWGPYESRIVMRQGDSPTNGPHQGGWIRDFEGKDWFLHFQDKGAYGRIIHLQPMCWKEDWPLIGEAEEGRDYGTPVSEWPLPASRIEGAEDAELKASDDFKGEGPGLQWQWYANPPENALRMENGLLLRAQNADGAETINLWQKANLLSQKLIAPSALYKSTLDAAALEADDAAGLAVLGDRYLALSLRGEGGRRLVLALGERGAEEKILQSRGLAQGPVTLCLLVRETEKGPVAQFAYEKDGQREVFPDCLLLEPNTWTGAKPALFAVTKGRAEGGEARFLNFDAALGTTAFEASAGADEEAKG